MYNEQLRRVYNIDAAIDALLDSIQFSKYVGDFIPGAGNTLFYSENPTTRIYKMDIASKSLIDSSTLFSGGAASFLSRPGHEGEVPNYPYLAVSKRSYAYPDLFDGLPAQRVCVGTAEGSHSVGT